MGSGIWSMHFIGLLAMPTPFPIEYDFRTTVLSLIIAILFSSLAFVFMSKQEEKLSANIGASLLLATGMTSMHYVGMYGVRLPVEISYNLSAVSGSIVIAALASFFSLRLFSCSKATPFIDDILKKVLSALLMGGGIASMHYLAMESAIVHITGSYKPIELDMNLIISIAIIIVLIQIVGIITILMDETIIAKEKIIELEKQFIQVQKMEAIGTLVGGITHDFNNMLAGITGNLYLAKKKMKASPAGATEKIIKAEELCEHASEMVKQLLTLARKDDVHHEVFSLTQYSEKSFKLAKLSIPKRIKCTNRVCDDELFIKGNKTEIQQLVINMANNARDALLDVEQAEISCSLSLFQADEEFHRKYPDVKADHLACLSIMDNGKGIPECELNTIFEPFYTTKEVGKGTGLGLSMAHDAVKSHGGEIEVESTVGEGTAFHMFFPTVELAVKYNHLEGRKAIPN